MIKCLTNNFKVKIRLIILNFEHIILIQYKIHKIFLKCINCIKKKDKIIFYGNCSSAAELFRIFLKLKRANTTPDLVPI